MADDKVKVRSDELTVEQVSEIQELLSTGIHTPVQISWIQELVVEGLSKSGLIGERDVPWAMQRYGEKMIKDLFATLRFYTQMSNNLIVFPDVPVDRSRDPLDVLSDTGFRLRIKANDEAADQVVLSDTGLHLRKKGRDKSDSASSPDDLCIDEALIEAMPRGEGKKVIVSFFSVPREISDEELAAEYEKKNLVPADAYSLAMVNQLNSDFSRICPNATHWKDASGVWHFLVFRWHFARRFLDINRHIRPWKAAHPLPWWYAGLPKTPADPALSKTIIAP